MAGESFVQPQAAIVVNTMVTDAQPVNIRRRKWVRRSIFLAPLPLLATPFLVLLGPKVIGVKLAALLFFPAGLLAYAFRNPYIALVLSGVFWYACGVALLAGIVGMGSRPGRPWWSLSTPAVVLIVLALIGFYAARCNLNWNPD